MANEIMSGLFGPSVADIQRQRQLELSNAATGYASQDPFQRAAAQTYQAGGMLGDVIAKATGGVDPQIEKARQSEALMGQPGTDLTTSEGLMNKAEQFRKIGDLRTATALSLRASEIRKQEAEMKKSTEPRNLPPEVQAMALLETLDPESNQAKMIKQWLADKRQVERMKAAKKAEGAGIDASALLNKMTREARLRAELGAGLIDQATYDAAMAATPGGKVIAARQASTEKARSFLESAGYDFNTKTDRIEQLIKESTSGSIANLGAKTASAFGISTKGTNAINELAATASKLTMDILGGKLGAGISNPDREFIIQQLGSISDPNIPAEARRQAWVAVRNRIVASLDKATSSTSSQTSATTAPSDFNAKWATLKSGQSLIGPDGKTYTKK